MTAENKAKGILLNHYGHHLGDFDCYQGYLFIPVTDDGQPYIAVFSAADLSFVTKQAIQRNGSYFTGIGWCAINPKDGSLYTSDKHAKNQFGSGCSPVVIYEIDLPAIRARSGNFLRYKAQLSLKDENGKALTLEHMQGGCFDNANHLHTNNGYPSYYGTNYANGKGGISIFTVPGAIIENTNYTTNRIAHSNQTGKSDPFRYQFNSKVGGEEPEGLTYWDLNDKRAPEITGVLHAIMLDNAGTGADDFYFKHYKRI